MDGAAYDLLQRAKCRLIMKEPFYGTIAMMFEFKESKHIPTMGVSIVSNGMVKCIYSPDFVKGLSLEQLYAVIMHECEHIIRMHPVREENRNHDGMNIAADFTINGKRSNPTCAYKEEGSSPIVPMEDGCFIPEDWPANENMETYYTMLPRCKKCDNIVPWDHKTGKASDKHKCGQNQSQQGQGQGQNQSQNQGQSSGGAGQQQGQGQGQGNMPDGVEVCPGCGRPYKPNGDYGGSDGAGGKLIDDHSTWRESDVSEDEARQIVKQIVDQAASNSQGNVPGHLKEFIDALNKPVVRWREIMRRFLGRHSGGCRKTYARRNRRYDQFGLKGASHHAVATLGVIIDTSGSISSDDLRQFFAEIEAISSKTKTWVLQWDTGLCDFQKRYRRGDWKTIEVKGRGGTAMDKSQDWVVDNNIPADAVIMLTDGYTGWRKEKMPMPFFVCLTTDTEDSLPDYAEHVKMPKR